MTDHDKTAQERERFEAWLNDTSGFTTDDKALAWAAWKARAALDTGAIPAGWKLVPEDATIPMVAAADGVDWAGGDGDTTAVCHYAAMTVCHECGASLAESDAQWTDDGSPFCKRHSLGPAPVPAHPDDFERGAEAMQLLAATEVIALGGVTRLAEAIMSLHLPKKEG